MEAWRVWLRRKKTISLKYHIGQFFLQVQTDSSFLLTKGTRQVDKLLEGEKRLAKNRREDRQERDTLGEGRRDMDMQKKRVRMSEALQMRRRMGRLR
jgi:hypothetical protein